MAHPRRAPGALAVLVATVVTVAALGAVPTSAQAAPAPVTPASPPAPGTRNFQVSAAVARMLRDGLRLPVGSALLTGLRPDRGTGTLRVRLATGPTLPVTLPAGVAAPAYDHGDLTIDPAADTLTLRAAATGSDLTVRVAHASTTRLTAGDLTSRVTLRVPVLGRPAALTGQLGYRRGVTGLRATGALPAGITLRKDTVLLEKGATVTVTGDGLRLDGTAQLGPAGHRLRVTVGGRLADAAGWSLAVRSGEPVAGLVPGLGLARAMGGTVTDGPGGVSYDVRGTATGKWRPLAGISISGASAAGPGVRFGNDVPRDGSIAAPGVAAGTPWMSVTGDVGLAAGAAGTAGGRGTVAVNLATGAAALTARQNGTLTLDDAPARLALRDARFGGRLTLAADGLHGIVTGTGLATVTRAGARDVRASATLTMDPAGTLSAAFPIDAAALDAGRSGTPATGHWSPAGLSARAAAATTKATTTKATTTKATTNAAAAPTAAGDGSYTMSSAVTGFLANTLGIRVSSGTIIGTVSGTKLTATVAAPGALPIKLPSGVPSPVFGPATVTVDLSTDSMTLTAGAVAGVTATLRVTIAGATGATDAELSGGGLSADLTLGNVPFLAGATVTLGGYLAYTGGGLTGHLTGSLDSAVSVAGGAVVLQPGLSLTFTSGTGLHLDGTALIGAGPAPYAVGLAGDLGSLSDWSLAITGSGQAWQPLSGLTLYPSFSATLASEHGAVTFDLSTDNVGSWAPTGDATFAFTRIELSNTRPAAAAGCRRSPPAPCGSR